MPRLNATLAALLAALFLVGCDKPADPQQDKAAPEQQTQHPSPSQAQSKAPPRGWTMPVLDAATFADLKNRAAADGRVLVVDFWATWCTPCKQLFGPLHREMAKRKDKVLLISVSTDIDKKPQDNYIARANQFLIDQNAWEHGYLAVSDDDKLAKLKPMVSDEWGESVPAVFVYGPDGGLVYSMDEVLGTAQEQAAEIGIQVDAALE